MKKFIVAAGLLAGLAGIGRAQNAASPSSTVETQSRRDRTPQERARDAANKAEKDLGLNAEQKGKWEAAKLKLIDANQPYREKLAGSTTPDERRDFHRRMMANARTFDSDVDAFLTPDQKAKRDQLKAQHRHKAKQRCGKLGL